MAFIPIDHKWQHQIESNPCRIVHHQMDHHIVLNLIKT